MTKALENTPAIESEDDPVLFYLWHSNGVCSPGIYEKNVEEAKRGAAALAKLVFESSSEAGRIQLCDSNFKIDGGYYLFTEFYKIPKKYRDAYKKWKVVRSMLNGQWYPEPNLFGNYIQVS